MFNTLSPTKVQNVMMFVKPVGALSLQLTGNDDKIVVKV